MLRWYVVSGVFQRNVKQYFTSVLGYLFIVVFVTVCAILTFNQQFFADNLANLDQLSKYFPLLLLFFVPAITMGIWAEERKQGTDALLFTLPASDLEIMLGKFLAVVSVYTIALGFSLTQLVALRWLGSPDMGIIFSTYIGYWLAGVAMLSIGMLASSLTRSSTIAFIVGGLLCAVPVLIGYYFTGRPAIESLSIPWQLRDFTLGQISLPGICYFVSIIALMLYLNLVVVTKRHWSRGEQMSLGGHFVGRVLALSIALVAANVIVDRSSVMFANRLDLTAEKLYTLDPSTRKTLAQAATAERPIDIQAFISAQVPRKFVNTRKNLIGLLRQYDRVGGNNLSVRFVNVQPNSQETKEAKNFGIEPRETTESIGGTSATTDVYLGLVITSSLDQVILPFVESESSIEYELTRAIAKATDESKKIKVGVLDSDYHFDYFRYTDPQSGITENINWGFEKTVAPVGNRLANFIGELAITTSGYGRPLAATSRRLEI